MEYVSKPLGASKEEVLEIEKFYDVDLEREVIDWWEESDGPDVYFGYKELQFFSVKEIIGEDIYQLSKYMPSSIPVCMDGNGNICVAKIDSRKITGFYVADCGDLGWDEAKLVAKTFKDFVNDKYAPEVKLNA